jgi:LysR family nitrogen assimilation transcriptional regulator
MDIRDLKCFVLTSELGSVTRAAGELGIVQSALSRKLQGLEEELGATLFTRLPRGIQLTPAGRVFVDRARRILREAEFAYTELKVRHVELRGTVTLGLSPTLAPLLAPDCLTQIATDFPGIQLKIVEAFSATLLDQMIAGRLDVAVLTNPPRTTLFQIAPAVSEEMVVVTPPGARGIKRYYTINELCREPVVMTSALRSMLDEQLRRHGRQLTVAAELDSVEAIRRLVARGQATTLMPASTFREDIAVGRLDAFQVVDCSLNRLLAIARPLPGRATPAITHVAETLLHQFSTLSDEGRFRLLPAPTGVEAAAGTAGSGDATGTAPVPRAAKLPARQTGSPSPKGAAAKRTLP